jgi:Ni,Fe-hydrogenase maturation factor
LAIGVSAMQVFVFGNEYIEQDKAAKSLMPLLQERFDKIDFIPCTTPEQLLEAGEDTIRILDVVKGIEKPIIIENVEQLKTNKLISLHDFDVAFFLNLMKELGIQKNIKILGIPATTEMDADLFEIINRWLESG